MCQYSTITRCDGTYGDLPLPFQLGDKAYAIGFFASVAYANCSFDFYSTQLLYSSSVFFLIGPWDTSQSLLGWMSVRHTQVDRYLL